MAGIVLKFLLRWWKEILIALVIVGAVWYVRNLQNTVEEQRTEITNLTTANKVLKDSNEVLTKTVTANNRTIEELSKGADQTKREFDKLTIQVEQQTRVLTKRLKDIMSRPLPETCEDTIKYMIDAVPTYQQGDVK